jgi:hypothetical protein
MLLINGAADRELAIAALELLKTDAEAKLRA